MVEAADPGYDSFDAHAEAAVLDGPVLAQVEIPLEGFEGEPVLLNPCEQEVVIRYAFRPADDLAVAFGGEDVYAESLGGVGGVGLHVEGLDGGGVAVNHDGTVELVGKVGLVGGAEVVAVFVQGLDEALGMGFDQHFVGIFVA